MSDYFGSKAAYLVNSGSSANLLMIATLISPQIKNGLRAWRRGHHAGGDVSRPRSRRWCRTGSSRCSSIASRACTTSTRQPGRGRDWPEDARDFCPAHRRHPVRSSTRSPPLAAKKHDLWLLEDGCDALGATWDGKLVGTFGAMSSISFYPAHHMTLGEGGMVVVNHGGVRKTCLSVRDWGRDCWCEPGVSDTCGKRFGWQLGSLPFGYDHKYTYSNLGYNLKVSEMQAGDRLRAVQEAAQPSSPHGARTRGFTSSACAQHEEHLIMPVGAGRRPIRRGSAFPITLKPHIDRRDFISSGLRRQKSRRASSSPATCSSSRLRGHSASRPWRADRHRHDYEPDTVHWRLSRPDPADDRVCC